MSILREYVPGTIWITEYGVRYFGIDLTARMSVIRLPEGGVLLHSPCEITPALAEEIRAIGPVTAIIAPGNFHYLHVPCAQAVFPAARSFASPGIAEKRPDLRFDAVLTDTPPPEWRGVLEQVVVQGSRIMVEVAFFHVASKTLLLVDLIENIGDKTPNTGLMLRLWWKLVFRMWNRPRPAPEYQMGWRDKRAAARSLQKILAWDFRRIILAHGDLIEENARETARAAWAKPLRALATGAEPTG